MIQTWIQQHLVQALVQAKGTSKKDVLLGPQKFVQDSGLLGCFQWLWAFILHTFGVQVLSAIYHIPYSALNIEYYIPYRILDSPYFWSPGNDS